MTLPAVARCINFTLIGAALVCACPAVAQQGAVDGDRQYICVAAATLETPAELIALALTAR